MSDLLFLLVALPLLASVVPLFLARRSARLARTYTICVLLAQLALVVLVGALVVRAGRLEYVVGAIPAAFGIGLLADRLSIVFVALVAVWGLAALLVDFDPDERDGSFYSLWLLLVAGLTGVTITADVFNLYVFLEISGLAAYALVASERGSAAALAALKYLLVGTVGATLYLLGVGYLFVAAGTLAMADLAPALASVGYDSPLVVAAFVLVAVGLCVKLALFPLHAWKPDAYSAAPVPASVLLAALGSTVAGYALVRLTFDVFTVSFLVAVPAARDLLLFGGTASIVAGGVLALREPNVRRLLAYSSILQFGLVAVGIALATPLAVAGALVHLVGHAVTKAGMFVAAGLFDRAYGARTVADYAGLAARAPIPAAAMATLAVTLVGLPPTVGFAAKWYVGYGAIRAESPVVAGIVLASTLLTLVYLGRVVERLYLGAPDGDAAGSIATDGGTTISHPGTARVDGRATLPSLVVLVGAAILAVALGLASTALVDWFAPVVEGWL